MRADWRSGAAGHFHEQARPLPPGAPPLPSTADLTLAAARAPPQGPNPDPGSRPATAPRPPAVLGAPGAAAAVQLGHRDSERAVDEDVDLLVAWEAEGDAGEPPRTGLHHLYNVRPQVPGRATCHTLIYESEAQRVIPGL